MKLQHNEAVPQTDKEVFEEGMIDDTDRDRHGNDFQSPAWPQARGGKGKRRCHQKSGLKGRGRGAAGQVR